MFLGKINRERGPNAGGVETRHSVWKELNQGS